MADSEEPSDARPTMQEKFDGRGAHDRSLATVKQTSSKDQ